MSDSPDGKDILLTLLRENSDQARHHEQQRAWTTAVVALGGTLVVGGVLAAGGTAHLGGFDLVVAGFLLGALGGYGFLASLHHHERSRLHVQRVHVVRHDISQRSPVLILDLYARATAEHVKRFAWLSNKTARVHWVWQGFNAVVAAAGLALATAGLLR
jgi:hypothetical protein